MNGLSKAQEDTLKAVVDALLPPLTAPSSHSDHRMFWEHRLSTDVHYMECLQDAIAKMRNEDRQKLKIVLSTLSTALGTTFVFGVLTRSGFCEWNVQERTKRLSQLEASFLETRRAIFQGLKQLVCGTAFTYTDPIGVNRFWNGMGYPGAPQTFQPIGQDEKLVAKAMQKQQPIIQNLKETAAAMNENRKDVLECDIVIVGSGSGGSVAAHVLSKAGYRVLIVEKGTYRAPESIPLSESDAMDQQYEQHGMLQTEDGAITIMAGSAVGGGTAINWSCCLPLPETVRNEWAKEFPEVFGNNSEYDIALQYILEKMGALDKSKVTHNAMNRKFQNGCEKLNYKWEVTGQVRVFPSISSLDLAGLIIGCQIFFRTCKIHRTSLLVILAWEIDMATRTVEYRRFL
jgi:long-chain-alcohol oxidase